MKDYAIYKGDTFLFVGTREECAKYLGVNKKTISFYSTPAYRKRIEQRKKADNALITIKLESE